MDNENGSTLPPVIGVPTYMPGATPPNAPNNFGSGAPSMAGTPTISAHPESEPGPASVTANMPGYAPANGIPPVATDPNGAMLQQIQIAPDPPAPKKDYSGLIKNIVIVILILCLLAAGGLFFWEMTQKVALEQKIDFEAQAQVEAALEAQEAEFELRLQDQQKYPYRTFTGPVNYGKLSFEFPRTWSVYVEKSAENGEEYKAYFNPDEVEAVSNNTPDALRLTISPRSYDEVINSYRSYVESKSATLSVDTRTIGNAKGTPPTQTTANYYTGTIPSTKFNGMIVVFKIRDKTIILQCDSKQYKAEFDKLLTTITFNA